MRDPYKLSKLDPCDQPCPDDAGRYAAEIARLGREFSLPLRLSWAPDIYAFLWGEKRRRYAQERFGRCEHVRRWVLGRLEMVNGTEMLAPRQYFKPDRYSLDIHALHMLPNGDCLQAEVDVKLIAEPRWIVEFKLPDRERAAHEQNRYDAERDRSVEIRERYDRKKQQFVEERVIYDYENPLTRVDALGPYPEDGKWGCYRVIAQHWIKCCQDANAEGRMCWGIGRPPHDGDLEEIRLDLQQRTAPMDPTDEHWDAKYKEEIRKINEIIAENQQGQRDLYDAIFDDAIMTTLRRVYNRNNPDKANQVFLHKEN